MHLLFAFQRCLPEMTVMLFNRSFTMCSYNTYYDSQPIHVSRVETYATQEKTVTLLTFYRNSNIYKGNGYTLCMHEATEPISVPQKHEFKFAKKQYIKKFELIQVLPPEE